MIICHKTRGGCDRREISRHHFTDHLLFVGFLSVAKSHSRWWQLQADKITNDCNTKRPNCNFIYCFADLFYSNKLINRCTKIRASWTNFQYQCQRFTTISTRVFLQSATRRLSLHLNRKKIFSRFSFVWWTWSVRLRLASETTTGKNVRPLANSVAIASDLMRNIVPRFFLRPFCSAITNSCT